MKLSIPPLDPALPGLCIAQRALPEPFLLEGARVRLAGRQTRCGGEALLCDEEGRASFTVSLQAPNLGRAANLVLYPGVARRDFVSSKGATSEALVASRTLPMLIWQLTGSSTGASRIRLELSTSTTLADVDHCEDTVTIRTQGKLAQVRIEPAPAEIEIKVAGGAVDLCITLADAETHSMALAFGDPGEVEVVMRATSHMEGHALRAAEGPYGALRLNTGITDVDEGVAWALARTFGLVSEHSSAALNLGLAAVAFGHPNVPTRALSHLKNINFVAAGLLAARLGLTTGDTKVAATLAAHLLDGVGTTESDLLPLAAGNLADALHYGATAEVLDSLRKMSLVSPDPIPTTRSSPRGTRLPMATTAVSLLDSPTRETSYSSWLRSLLTGNPSHPPSSFDVRLSRARRSAELFRVDPDRAWRDWRILLEEGLNHGPAGPATWDDIPSNPDSQIQDYGESLTAELLLALAHGLLGLAPDAPFGRLRIAPRIPSHLVSFEVKGVQIGDGEVSVAYQREREEINFTLKPDRVGIPPLIIFEPLISGTVQKVLVDGKNAELNLKSVNRHTVVPIQLPLDCARTMTIVTG